MTCHINTRISCDFHLSSINDRAQATSREVDPVPLLYSVKRAGHSSGQNVDIFRLPWVIPVCFCLIYME